MKHICLFILATLLASCNTDSSTGLTQKTDLERRNLNGNIEKVEQKVFLGEEINGKVRKTDTLIAELSWNYNNNGFRTNLHHKFYEGGENTAFDFAFPEHREKREYNESGLLSKVIYLFEDMSFSEDRFTYNENDLLIKKTKHNSDSDITEITNYSYNKSGKLIESTRYLPDGRMVEKETINYKNHRKALVEKYNRKNVLIESTSYTYYNDYYEERGEWSYMKLDYEDRKLIWKNEAVPLDIRYEYDTKGNIVKEEDSNDGYKKRYSYEYDNTDNPILEICKSYQGGKLKSIVVIETKITYY